MSFRVGNPGLFYGAQNVERSLQSVAAIAERFACSWARLTCVYGLLPQVGNRSILISNSGFGLQSYIRHLEWDQVVPCRHGIRLPGFGAVSPRSGRST